MDTGEDEVKYYCETYTKKKNVYFEWKIKDFYQRKRTCGEHIESSNFSLGFDDEWFIKIFPHGMLEYPEDFVIILERKKCSLSISAGFQVGYINDKGKESHAWLFDLEHHIGKKGKIKELARRTNIMFPHDTLTIFCRGHGEAYEHHVVCKNSEGDLLALNADILPVSNLTKLLNEKFCCDVTFTVGNREFIAHKVFLASQSSVFKDLFTNFSKDRFDIVDTTPEVFEKMLEFIYTEKVSHVYKVVKELIRLSYNYQLKNLKSYCGKILCKTINVHNVIEFLKLSDQYNVDILKKASIDFINNNVDEMTAYNKNDELSALSQKLLCEILQARISLNDLTTKIFQTW